MLAGKGGGGENMGRGNVNGKHHHHWQQEQQQLTNLLSEEEGVGREAKVPKRLLATFLQTRPRLIHS